MSTLDKVFGTQKKLEGEKGLEVITTDSAILDAWSAYFEQTKNPSEVWESDTFLQNKFSRHLGAMKKYVITPQMIYKFSQRIDPQPLHGMQSADLGILFSALIQTSYDQGYNNFEIEKVDSNYFGSYLKGQENKKLNVTINTFEGRFWLFEQAEHCAIEIINHNSPNGSFGAPMCGCTVYCLDDLALKRLFFEVHEFSECQFKKGSITK